MLALVPCGKLSGAAATNAGLVYAMVSGQEMLLVVVDPSELGTFVHGISPHHPPEIPVISICAVPEPPTARTLVRFAVMSEAPQVTTGVTRWRWLCSTPMKWES